jgi:uncharacterized protein (UPF0548 family)
MALQPQALPIYMSITFFRPEEAQITAFLEQESTKSFTYPAVGATAHEVPVAGHDNDYQYVVIGKGASDFEKARQAIREWAQFPSSWTTIFPVHAPVKEGAVIALFFKLFGFWWRNSCRIVYVWDEPNRYGFAYGTLPGHIESGEEVFWVQMDPDGQVGYGIKAFSKPKNRLVRLGYPFARMMQEKFRQDSAAAMRQYLHGTVPNTLAPNRWAWHVTGFCLAAILLWPGSMMGHHYGYLPLAFAFFLLVPLVFLTVGQYWPKALIYHKTLADSLLATSALAIASTMLPAGWGAAILALPWLLMCTRVAWSGIKAIRSKTIPIPVALGLLYLAIGGAWFWADRAGISPLGFGQDIVLLTALHFHFAGFALPVLIYITASGLRKRPLMSWIITIAVPLTAIGITATHYRLGPFMETLAAIIMSLSACIGALYLLVFAKQTRSIAMGVAGVVLLFTMSLAFTYGIRAYWPYWALELDHMRAIHGTLNGLVAMPAAFWAIWYHSVQLNGN